MWRKVFRNTQRRISQPIASVSASTNTGSGQLIRYYHQIEQGNGSDFARLFLVPGMNHCVGGPGLDDFDALGTIERWVENAVPPDSMLASGQAFPGRTRPLCAYPKSAKYRGAGNTENAASFSCEQMQVGGDSIKQNK